MIGADTLLYRSATTADVEQLRLLGLASYGQYAPELEPEHLEGMRSRMSEDSLWLDLLAVAKGFVCVYGDRVIGMAFLVPSGNPWEMFEAEWSYFRMVGVEPAYQGRGIASRLTGMCIEHAKATGEQFIALHTSEMMHAARHIYEKAGFRVVREIPQRLGKRYWLYLLEL